MSGSALEGIAVVSPAAVRQEAEKWFPRPKIPKEGDEVFEKVKREKDKRMREGFVQINMSRDDFLLAGSWRDRSRFGFQQKPPDLSFMGEGARFLVLQCCFGG